jgi:Porin subfamily
MARAPARMLVHTVAIIAIATVLAAVAASGAVAQTPPSPTTAAPKALPRSFQFPAVAPETAPKTAPFKSTKSCSVYGDGFVNVPGTDTCVKTGGYMRSDAAANH